MDEIELSNLMSRDTLSESFENMNCISVKKAKAFEMKIKCVKEAENMTHQRLEQNLIHPMKLG